MAEEKKEPVSEQGTQELTNDVRDYQNGDAEAFNIIYELSYRYLYVCIRNIIGSEDESRDILQNTYMDIAKSISSLNQAEAFLSWAGVIARRECYAYLKKNKNIVPIDTDDEIFGNLEADEEFIPENVMQDKEKQRLIMKTRRNLWEESERWIRTDMSHGMKCMLTAKKMTSPISKTA